MVKLLLIHPSNDDNFKNLRPVYKILPPPTGLAVLASYINKHNINIKIEIWDGNYHSDEEITKNLYADYVGVSNWYSNHKNALNIAKLAKTMNPDSKVIIGGPNASNLGMRLLENRDFIDYVVVGDGEECLLKIIQNKHSKKEIPNLWYRENGEIKYSYSSPTDMNTLPVFTFDQIVNFNPNVYDCVINQSFHRDISPIPISSVRGCVKAVLEGPCEFCALSNLNKLRAMNPKNFWEQISYLNKRYNFTHYFETGDDFIVGDYAKLLLSQKPSDVDAFFRVYANPMHINREKLELLKELGIYEIFIGIESLNKDVLEQAKKNIDKKHILELIQYAQDLEIGIFPSFILGLPKETKESMEETTTFINYILSEFKNIKHLLLSTAVPIIGSAWFNNLQNEQSIRSDYYKQTNEHLQKTDVIDYKVLLDLSLEKYSNVTIEDISTAIKNIIKLNSETIIASYSCL